MSSREEQVLALARQAWQAGQPSEEEIEAGASRVARRMRRSAPARRFKRPAAVLAFAVVFGGALAYAASGGVHFRSSAGDSKASSVSPLQQGAVRAGVQKHFGKGPASLLVPKPEPESTDRASAVSTDEEGASRDDAAPSRAPATPETKSSPTGADPKRAAALASSWREVDEALGQKDDSRAGAALEKLSKSDDGTTRAKAELGLAQLAQAKGDCSKARRLALEIIRRPGVDPSVVRRAQAIVLTCD